MVGNEKPLYKEPQEVSSKASKPKTKEKKKRLSMIPERAPKGDEKEENVDEGGD